MWLQIAIPVAVFTGVVLALSALVIIARRKLEPSGKVIIDLNGQRDIEVEAGGKLLNSLAAQGVFLPAACGGRGSCGQCRVEVLSGGGPPLPTERVLLSASEIEAGTRLACMVKVRESLSLRVPETSLAARKLTAVVESTDHVACFLKEITLKFEDGGLGAFDAGAYVLLEAPAHRCRFRDFDLPGEYLPVWRDHGFLRLESNTRAAATRAYSLANPPLESDRAVLVVRIATPPPTAPAGTPPGQVSSYIFSLAPGDQAALFGPFGEFHATENSDEMVLIAGGAGIAPMRSIILDQLGRGTGRKMSFWYGARDMGDLCYAPEFEGLAERNENFEYHVALSNPLPDSPWSGHTGFIHSVLYEQYLKNHPGPAELEYYLCGPPLMSTAVIRMLEQLGVDEERIFFDDFGA